MTKKLKIMVMGDVHGNWEYLNAIINRHHPDIILQCGDFGFFPKWDDHMPKRKIENRLKMQDTKLYWCDGNHEDHWTLLDKHYKGQFSEILPNCFFATRGSVLELPDGRNVMFMGGGDSIDKAMRMVGYDWFPEEQISQGNLYEALQVNKKIDIVISHQAPSTFPVEQHKYYMTHGQQGGKIDDPSRDALNELYLEHKPALWYFGHWHIYTGGRIEDTKWTCLNMSHRTGFWEWLP